MDTIKTPQVTEAELDLRAADTEKFAELFNRRHRTRRVKRSSQKAPQFILRTQCR